MKKYTEINIGDTEELRHTITQEDLERFVALTGDDNKLHTDAEFSKSTSFGKPVVHGMLGASFISTVIGTKLPGDGALWFSQTLEFLLPVRIGDELKIKAEVVKKIDKEKIIELKIDITNQDRQLVTKGISKVKVIETKKEAIASTTEVKELNALVIGGTGGIGQAVCGQLAADGFHVFIHFHSNNALAEKIHRDILSRQGKATVLRGDIGNAEHVNEMANTFTRHAAHLNVLVNCSSIKIPRIHFKDLKWTDFADQISFHVKSQLDLAQCFQLPLEKSGSGKIISIGTLAVDKPNADWAHYITAKAALHGLTKAMAFELGPKGIQVNMVSPGLTDTELTADIGEKIKLVTAAQTPARRLASVEDIAGAISFLASPKSNFLTGENIRVNGGQVMI